MKIAIMQPYFLPYIGYWQLIYASDLFLILDDVQYIKRGWINRNRILCDGREKYIVMPVSHASQNTLIKDLDFVYDIKQLADIEKTIAYAYRKAPYLTQTLEVLYPVLWNQHRNIAENLEYQIRQICKYLGIQTAIMRTSHFRDHDHPKSESGIIALAKTFSATHYINPIGGTSIYHKETFEKANIELSFLQTDFSSIQQLSGHDRMDLSIIDLFANYPLELIQRMLDCYDLVK